MSESAGRASRGERYQFNWSSSGGQSVVALTQSVPEVAADDPSILQNEGPMPVEQIADQLQEEQKAGYPVFDEKSLSTFRSSPKSRSGIVLGSFTLTPKVQLVAILGWSCLAGAGAAALMSNPGPVLGMRLSELGAVWGGISALIWFLPHILSR